MSHPRYPKDNYQDRKRKDDDRSHHDIEKKPKVEVPTTQPIDLSSPKLDILSEDFDPLLALYTLTDIPKGLPKVKPMDSIQRCRFILPPDDPNYKQYKKKEEPKKEPEFEISKELRTISNPDSTTITTSFVGIVDAADKIKEIDAQRTKARIERQKLRKMREGPPVEPIDRIMAKCEKGPLSMLLKCVKEKAKVKVLIRRVADIRGFVIGFLQAADKHFNMILKEVYEEFSVYEYNEETRRKELVPKRRWVKQLFVKGDNVVIAYRFVESVKENV